MKFVSSKTEEVSINLTPLIDVVFLLLIFFMVSTTFTREAQLEIRLPETENTPQQQLQPSTITVTIGAAAGYSVSVAGSAVTTAQATADVATLTEALQLAAQGLRQPLIIIRADAKTPHERVMTALEAARHGGFSRIAFATRVAPE
ncbi:MAG: biopolymer transporter ExbD [Arenicellales bacterium]|nr:biopolymer transporter ExbD [Arenicellales bacterium]